MKSKCSLFQQTNYFLSACSFVVFAIGCQVWHSAISLVLSDNIRPMTLASTWADTNGVRGGGASRAYEKLMVFNFLE